MAKTPQSQIDYSRGYAAGRKRQIEDAEREAINASEREFWEKAVLTASTYFMGCTGWTQGDKTLNSLTDRAKLAVDWANELVAARRKKH